MNRPISGELELNNGKMIKIILISSSVLAAVIFLGSKSADFSWKLYYGPRVEEAVEKGVQPVRNGNVAVAEDVAFIKDLLYKKYPKEYNEVLKERNAKKGNIK